MKATLSIADLEKAQAVPGVYWAVAYGDDGTQIYKQEEHMQGPALYIFWCGGANRGWYLATRYFVSATERKAGHEDDVVAWLGDADFPHTVQMPCWHETDMQGATIISYIEWVHRRIYSRYKSWKPIMAYRVESSCLGVSIDND